MLRIKQLYLNFLEKNNKNAAEIIFDYFLGSLSYFYRAIIAVRNLSYDWGIFHAYSPKAKVISIGNISWSGSGKTSLAIWLNKKLSSEFKVAILRRGYGRDEELLLQEFSKNIYSKPNRCRLAKELDSQFEIFILDDGFQYRKLKRDIDLVILGAREFLRSRRLIPADFFRESWSSLSRANMVLVNYADEISDRPKVISEIKKFSANSKLYFSKYTIKGFIDLNSKVFNSERLKSKKLAAFTAIGYPQGFFNKLKEFGLDLVSKITYPDHHELSNSEYENIESGLLSQGISDLIITAKDKYHLPAKKYKINILIMEVELEIENEEYFLSEIRSKLLGSSK